MVVHFVTQPQGQPVVQPFFTQIVEIDFSFFCSLRNVFFIQESDWEGNQSYSNFLEVCKLAGVLTTINKPTTGFFLCQIWTIIRPPGLLQPQLLILTQVSPFSLSQLYFSRYIAVSVKVNLRPFLWQLFLANAAPAAQIRLLFVHQLLWQPEQLLWLQSPNRNVSFQLHKKNRQHATRSLIQAVFVYTFHSLLLIRVVMGMPLMAAKRGRWHSRQARDSNQLPQSQHSTLFHRLRFKSAKKENMWLIPKQ